MPIGRARDPSAVMNGTDIWNAAKRGSKAKVPPWQRPSSTPVPSQGVPGGQHSLEEVSPLSA